MEINPNAFIPDIGLPKSEVPTITPLDEAGASISNDGTAQSFRDTIMGYLKDVNGKITTSDAKVKDLAEGKSNDLNGVVTSVEEANLALQYTIAMRSKLIDAYQEISRITV